jgi:hypothetical protein
MSARTRADQEGGPGPGLTMGGYGGLLPGLPAPVTLRQIVCVRTFLATRPLPARSAAVPSPRHPGSRP